ncbi:MAG: hypothetical protein K0Q58_1210 [Microbacterium sp.]|nr:hypothetical protein [Microbacterium sp.]
MKAPSSWERPSCSGSRVAGFSWPVIAMADVAIRSPSIRAPESPMNIFARFQFSGRNPAQAPTRTTAMNDAKLK